MIVCVLFLVCPQTNRYLDQLIQFQPHSSLFIPATVANRNLLQGWATQQKKGMAHIHTHTHRHIHGNTDKQTIRAGMHSTDILQEVLRKPERKSDARKWHDVCTISYLYNTIRAQQTTLQILPEASSTDGDRCCTGAASAPPTILKLDRRGVHRISTHPVVLSMLHILKLMKSNARP